MHPWHVYIFADVLQCRFGCRKKLRVLKTVERLGFIICSLALLLVLMFFIDRVETKTALIVSFGSTFLVWAALTEALKIQLPAGILAGAPEDALRAIARGGINAVAAIFSFIFR